jgi:pimeloyl-ACP methyl ester carboxylesterase
MRLRNKIAIGILLVVTIVLVGFVVWAETPFAPMPEAFEALQSDSAVRVTINQWLVFEPVGSNKDTGFIVYPGGRVDYRSYAPLAHTIATEGYLVIIAPMPFNLAILGVNTASDIIHSYSQITSWAIGGHSLGGTMAAQFAYENPSKIEGLLLWAAYPASGTDLSKRSLLVTTIHGTNDGLVSGTQIQDSLKLLPPNTVWVEITGGNHAQFGWYGNQPGDNVAEITREQQQSQIASATLQLLQQLWFASD